MGVVLRRWLRRAAVAVLSFLPCGLFSWEFPMDLLFLGLITLLFALGFGLVVACGRV